MREIIKKFKCSPQRKCVREKELTIELIITANKQERLKTRNEKITTTSICYVEP